MDTNRWNTTTKLIVGVLLGIAAIWLLYIFRSMISPTIAALLLAFVLSYPVNLVQRQTGWTRGGAVVSVYVLVLALMALTPVFFIPRLFDQLDSLQSALNRLVGELQSAPTSSLPLFGNWRINVDNLLAQVGTLLQTLVSYSAAGAFGIARGVTTGVLTTVYVTVISFWVVKDMPRMQRYIMDQAPASYASDIRRLGTELAAIWNAFLRGQLVLGLVVGGITWLVMSIVGLPNAGGLALLAGVMEFLPTIGPGISGAIGTAVALFSGSTWLPVGNVTFAILVCILYIVITQVESVYLIPRFVGRRVKLHPAVTFAAIINAAIVFGVLGVLLAAPTLASARTLLSYIYRKLFDIEPFDETPAALTSLRIQGLVAGHRIEGVVFNLDGVLAVLDISLVDRISDKLRWLELLLPVSNRRHLVRRGMVVFEGGINRWINFLEWMQLQKDLHRMQPWLDWMRGYPPLGSLQLRPEAPALLERLAQRYKLALVSTRSRPDVDFFLQEAQLPAHLFQAIVTRESMRNLPPHSDASMAAAQHLQLEPAQILMVGDSDIDLRPARATGMATAGVLIGLGEAQDMQDASLTLTSLHELQEWL